MIKWHLNRDNFPTGEMCIALYDVFGLRAYIPCTEYDRCVRAWVTLKEINEAFGVNWTAEEHCAALN